MLICLIFFVFVRAKFLYGLFLQLLGVIMRFLDSLLQFALVFICFSLTRFLGKQTEKKGILGLVEKEKEKENK